MIFYDIFNLVIIMTIWRKGLLIYAILLYESMLFDIFPASIIKELILYHLDSSVYTAWRYWIYLILMILFIQIMRR